MLRYVRRALDLPPRVAARKAHELASYRWERFRRRIRDRWAPDPLDDAVFRRRLGALATDPGLAARLFRGAGAVLPVRWAPIDADPAGVEALRQLAARTLEHRFDLLGSGSVRVGYLSQARGVEGHRYEMAPGPEAAEQQRQRMERLLPGSAEGYDPIDWHVDFKSGFRWSPEAWCMDLEYGLLPGVDVKVPWDLSRMQHVGALGLTYRLDAGGDEGRRAAREFRSQVVDWIAANPVRRGVNWLCAMDVGIRAINWLAGLALFEDAPEITPEFRWLVAKSLHAHGVHIESHLEYSPRQAGNHYLANVVGLLCIAAALPELPGSDRWMLWSLQELVSEMDRQVRPDGADFEGSTSYHLFVTEMFLLGTIVGMRLPPQRRASLRRAAPGRLSHPRAPRLRPYPAQEIDVERPSLFPASYLERLAQMGGYASDVMKPTGVIPLVGDHDSGRMYKLWPAVRWDGSGEPIEETRDRRNVLALLGVLYGSDALRRAGEPFSPDAVWLLGGLDAGVAAEAVTGGPEPARSVRRHRGGSGPGDLAVYPDAGSAVARAGPLHLVISFGEVPEGGSGGHFHNDLLSFELHWGGEDFVIDPGTYLYTAAPALRNRFRSTRVHNTVAVQGVEQREWPGSNRHLFSVLRDADVTVLEERADALTLQCRYGGVRHTRAYRWDARTVRIEDEVSGGEEPVLRLTLAPEVRVAAIRRTADAVEARLEAPTRAAWLSVRGVDGLEPGEAAVSPGYGELVPTTCLQGRILGGRATTVFEFQEERG